MCELQREITPITVRSDELFQKSAPTYNGEGRESCF